MQFLGTLLILCDYGDWGIHTSAWEECSLGLVPVGPSSQLMVVPSLKLMLEAGPYGSPFHPLYHVWEA